MSRSLLPLLLALLLLSLLCSPTPAFSSADVSRSDFPPDFVFGAGTSAYQWEGAVNEDGRGISVWDSFTHAGSGFDGTTADVTADGYHHYKGDVKLVSDIGLEGYRFSISWPRIIPSGRGAINPKGIQFYNNLIDELVSHGIQPHVTLFHFDLPQVLEDEYGGWLNPQIIDDFLAYADVCFEEFGDRISYWTTINELNMFALGAYDDGIIPPGRCSPPFSFKCSAGNSTTEPYIAMHNMLLAHARVAELYRKKYKAIQNGQVGMNIYSFTFYPKTDLAADMAACQRAFDFIIGWVLNPIIFGDYPEVMKMAAKWKLPSFSKEQSELLRGSMDFLGINYYTSLYISDKPDKYDESGIRDLYGDAHVIFSGFTTHHSSRHTTVTTGKAHDVTGHVTTRSLVTWRRWGAGQKGCVTSQTGNLLTWTGQDGKNSEGSKDPPSDDKFDPASLPFDPEGLENSILSLKRNYGDIPIFIHENGFGTPCNVTTNDTERIDYIKSSMKAVLSATRSGVDCRGYFVWSFLDVFETLTGFVNRYGLYYVDFEDENRRRRPKMSALWIKDFLKPKNAAAL